MGGFRAGSASKSLSVVHGRYMGSTMTYLPVVRRSPLRRELDHIMKRIIPLSFLLLLLLAACAPAAPSQEAVSRPDASTVTVYRAPT